MKISGEHTFPCSAKKVYRLLVDPDILLHTLPGLKALEPIGAHTYQAHIEVGVAGLSSSYHGHIQMKNMNPPNSYILTVEGDGPMGGLKANVTVNITSLTLNESTVAYAGQIDVHGKVAGLGQKVLSGVASTLVHQFFRNLLKEVQQSKEFQLSNEKKRTSTTNSNKKSKSTHPSKNSKTSEVPSKNSTLLHITKKKSADKKSTKKSL